MDGKLEAKNISMHFKDYQALSDVNFTLEGNKIVGLIGRNGAGKNDATINTCSLSRCNSRIC